MAEFDENIKGYIEPVGSVNDHLNAEELECIDTYLDENKVPNHVDGEKLSRVGRIMAILGKLP